MKRYIIILLYLSLLLNSCHPPKPLEETKFELVTTLTEEKLPIITLDIQGSQYDFLIATDATNSLIDSSTCVTRKLQIQKALSPKTIVTIGGTDSLSEEVTLLDESFYVKDLQTTIKEVKYHTGITIDGVIGSDILIKNDCIINFKEQLISRAH